MRPGLSKESALFDAVSKITSSFVGSTIRRVGEIKDAGAVLLCIVRGHDRASAVKIDDNRRDIWVESEQVTGAGIPQTGRLHIPANCLFRLPREDDHITVLRPAEMGAPGDAFVLHGDGSETEQIPQWLTEQRSGVSVPENLRLESTSNDVEIQAPAGKVKLQNGGRGIARIDDAVTASAAFLTWINAVAVATGVPYPGGPIGSISTASTVSETS